MDPIRVSPKDLCTLDQASARLGVTPDSFRLLIDGGDLMTYVGVSRFGTEYVLKADVDALKAELDAPLPPVSDELAKELADLRRQVPNGSTILS